jgi:hypothetical protein
MPNGSVNASSTTSHSMRAMLDGDMAARLVGEPAAREYFPTEEIRYTAR